MPITDKNRLSVVFPDLVKEWCWDKNLINPDMVSIGSSKKVFWKCLKCGEDWDAKISHRTQGSGCPKCARFYFKKQSLLNALPEIVKIWHPTKNSFTPDMVGRGSDRKVWFICEKKHIWQAAVFSVFINLKKTGKIPCPFCTGKKINKENCILTLFPDLVKEWHPIKNGVLTPENVGKGSTKHVWWLCKKGHEWSTTVNIRTSQETGCPYCNSSRLSIENNLAVVNPSIAKLWHPTKNGEKFPSQITSKTNESYWWKCEKGHEWKTRVSHLVNGLSGCPKCSQIGLKDGSYFKSLIEAFWYLKFKNLGLEFIYDKNYPKNKKIGRCRYDFYFPKLNLYVEVTGFGKEWKYWIRYMEKINKKKNFVENTLHANFSFISYSLSNKDRAFVKKFIK